LDKENPLRTLNPVQCVGGADGNRDATNIYSLSGKISELFRFAEDNRGRLSLLSLTQKIIPNTKYL